MLDFRYKTKIKDIQDKYKFKIFCYDATGTSIADFNANAAQKTQEFNQNAVDKTNDFDEHVESIQAELDEVQQELEKAQQDLSMYKMLENALPKVEGEGESITLDGTAQTPMHLNFKGQIQQDSTTGKNLLNYENLSTSATNVGIKVDSDGYIYDESPTGDSRGFAYTSANWTITLPAGNYIINVIAKTKATSSSASLFLYTSNSTLNGSIGNLNNVSNLSYNINLSQETTIYILMKVYDGVFRVQLEDGTSITDWEQYTGNAPSPSPSYPQDIHIVSGDNEIKVCNKNLFDKNSENIITNKFLNASGGEISDGSLSISDYIKVNPNTDYSIIPYQNIGACLCYYDSSKTFISSIGRYAINQTFTTPNNCYYIRTSFRNNEINNFMLEKGSIATDYVEHKEYTKEINLGDIEVGGIGEYEDEFFKNTTDSEYYDSTLLKDKWYLKKRIEKTKLTRNFTWNASSTYKGSFYADITSSQTIPYSQLYCTHFVRANISESGYIPSYYKYGTCFIENRNGQVNFWWNNGAADINNFKDWLDNNDVYITYPLATPENILLNDTLQETLDSFYSWQEQTNISQENNDLPFVIKASAIYDLSNLLPSGASLTTSSKTSLNKLEKADLKETPLEVENIEEETSEE